MQVLNLRHVRSAQEGTNAQEGWNRLAHRAHGRGQHPQQHEEDETSFHSLSLQVRIDKSDSDTVVPCWQSSEGSTRARTRFWARLRKKEIFERAHMTLVRRIPLLVLAVFISLSTAFGQTSGSIRGTVQDPPGAIVAGAKVTATWQERKTSHVASTSTSRNSSSSRINSVELWAGRFSLFRSSAKSARGISNAMWSIVEVAAPSRDNRDSRSGRTRRALECDLRSRPQS